MAVRVGEACGHTRGCGQGGARCLGGVGWVGGLVKKMGSGYPVPGVPGGSSRFVWRISEVPTSTGAS